MKKILTFGIMLMFLLMTMSSPAEESTLNDDIEIKIYTGPFGLNIGMFLIIEINLHKNENITGFLNYSQNFLFTNFREGTFTHKFTYEGKGNYTNIIGKYFLGFGIDLFSISVEYENNSVTRNGVWIGVRLCILFK